MSRASTAAAQAEGYALIQTDRGAAIIPRYESKFERWCDGDGQSGYLRRVAGTDNTSQANADTIALASLNAYRRYAFGTDGTNVNKSPRTGQTLQPSKN
jgi:hypothetical protein